MLDTFINWFIYIMAFIIGNGVGYYHQINIVGFLNTQVKPVVLSTLRPYVDRGKALWSNRVMPYVAEKQTLITERINYYEKQTRKE